MTWYTAALAARLGLVSLAVVTLWRPAVTAAVSTQLDYSSGELENESIPQGAASLAFVFDITGSMYDDLVQVIEGAAKILATTLARREKPLYNYVLVPFHDPGKPSLFLFLFRFHYTILVSRLYSCFCSGFISRSW